MRFEVINVNYFASETKKNQRNQITEEKSNKVDFHLIIYIPTTRFFFFCGDCVTLFHSQKVALHSRSE